MSGLYAANGSLNLTVVSGSSRTGRYAAGGSLNVVKAAGSTPVGLNHPCGAMWVTLVTSGQHGFYAADGSMNVALTPFTSTGAQRVTVVSGSLSSSDFLLLANGSNYLLLTNGTDRLLLAGPPF